jgi:hypothetical protein
MKGRACAPIYMRKDRFSEATSFLGWHEIGISKIPYAREVQDDLPKPFFSCYRHSSRPPSCRATTFPLPVSTPHLSNPGSFVLRVNICKEEQICLRVRVPLVPPLACIPICHTASMSMVI